MEGGWLFLAVIAWRSSAARPFALLLVASWLYAYACIIVGEFMALSYAWALSFDVWALAVGLGVYVRDQPRRRRAWWMLVVLAGWVVSITLQAAYWWALEARGAWFGVEMFHAGRAIFTVQMLTVAWPGAYCLWLDHRGRKGKAERYGG